MRRIVTVEPAGSKGGPPHYPVLELPDRRVLASPRCCGGRRVEPAAPRRVA